MRRISLIILFCSSFSIAQSANQYIQKGDSVIQNFFQYQTGLDFYYSALELDPNNISLLNKISKASVAVGDYLYLTVKNTEDELKFGDKRDKESLDSTEIEGAQLENFQKALKIADKTIQLEPHNAEAYVRRAIANARIAVTKGIFSVASLVNKVKDDLEFAIKLGTGGNDVQAFAHYVLAKTHDEVSEKWEPARNIIGLGWGDIEIAIKEYNNAIQLKSDVVMFYLDYAKALLEEDMEDVARSMLKKIEHCKIMEPEDNKRIKEAKKLLTSLE